MAKTAVAKRPQSPAIKRKVGRPSIYSETLTDRICDLLMNGESMIAICKQPGLPNRQTIINWLETNADFSARCARAREWQAEYMDDLILETAKRSKAETAAADRVKISAFQWRAMKLRPKKYGDHVDEQGASGTAIQINITNIDARTL